MTRLRPLKYGQVARCLQRLGFRHYRTGKGSHELWVRDSDGRVVPVPRKRGKEIKKGTLRAIIKEIGTTVEEFFGE